ncbi:MAG: LysE family transporter [Firmicutes bacterium]|nr:LysE family transporter [Bacillota bacterium]
MLKGILIGLVFGVPIGAVGALTVRRAIGYGFLAGLISGLGCSAADLLYSCISVFSLTFISDFLLKYQYPISIIGGAMVIIMGISAVRNPKTFKTNNTGGGRLAAIFASSFGIAITNPATIVTFITAFSIFNVGSVETPVQGISLICGIFAGTLIWWLTISAVFGILRYRVTDKQIEIINRVLGATVICFGIAVIARAVICSV